jgi:folate-dependent phosphoribosylglycinamide formyltransferase PurN
VRVVALCERLSKASELQARLSAVPGIELFLLVANTAPSVVPARFAATQIHDFAREGVSGQLSILRAVAQRRLRISRYDIHDEHVLAWLRGKRVDVGLHAMGVVYRRPVLDCFAVGLLNAHIGLLPEYRGRCVMEWSLLRGDPTGITVFFIDEGIDTGPRTVLRRELDVSGFTDVASAKRFLFSLDAELFAQALEALQRPDFELQLQDPSLGRRYYVMSSLFREVVELLLRGKVSTSEC